MPLFPLSPDSTAKGPVMFLVLLLTEDTFYFVLLNTLECSKIAEAHSPSAGRQPAEQGIRQKAVFNLCLHTQAGLAPQS